MSGVRGFVVWLTLLALGAVASGACDVETRTPDRAAKVVVRTDAGESLRGDLTAWDDFELRLAEAGGAKRIVAWDEIEPGAAFNLRRRLIGRDDAPEWLALGALMIDAGDARRAERAFVVARRLDEDLAAAFEARARELAAGGAPARCAVSTIGDPAPRDAAPREGGGGRPPGAGGGPGDDDDHADAGPDLRQAFRGARPWPALTPERMARETERLRALAVSHCEKIDLDPTIIETRYFLFVTDLADAEARRWARTLDQMYLRLCEMLEIDAETPIFNGKAVIFVFRLRDTFLRFEAEVYGFDAQRAGGVFHPRGGDCFVVFPRGRGDAARFQSVLVHETVHAFTYRYLTPAELPTWANEGLADYIAGLMTPASQEPRMHWQHVRDMARDGRSPLPVLFQEYRDGTWFDNDSYPVSHMMVRFIVKYKGPQFRAWIRDVKLGAEWRNALSEHLGVTPESLAEGLIAETKSESYYTGPK